MKHQLNLRLLVLAMTGVMGWNAAAQNVTFLPTTGNWNVPGNWSGGIVPNASQNPIIYNGKTATVDANVGTCASLFVGQSTAANRKGTVLFRTAEGTKLFSTVMSDKVLFEVDDHTVAEGWSVIIRGTAQVLNASDEIHEAERAQLLPWVPTEKLRFVRITPVEVSGRRFQFGPEPEHGAYPS